MIQQRTKAGWKHPRLAITTLGLALAASACGSSTTGGPEVASIANEPTTEANTATDSDSPAEPESVDPEEAFAKFEACMAEQGVKIGFSGVGGAEVPGNEGGEGSGDDLEPGLNGNLSPEALNEAQAICEPILDEAFGSFELSPEQEAEQADKFLEMQQCLTDAGFEIELDGGIFELPPGVDSDEFNTALRGCQDFDLPGFDSAGS